MGANASSVVSGEVVRVFVSYAREDKRWLDPAYRYNLVPYLAESLRRLQVTFWFDKQLNGGDEYLPLIKSEIDQSQIALLIVSQSFLNSEFIENREMPRIAERARLGKMIVVPVLVEPCDWSEYRFLADRQMVPSSPLIDYTESEPSWAKVRFQILDGLKAQVKRIRQTPQPEPANALMQPAEPGETVAAAVDKKQEQGREAEVLQELEIERQACEASKQEAEAFRIEAEEQEKRKREMEARSLKEAAEKQAREDEERKARVVEAAKQKEIAERKASEAAAQRRREEEASLAWRKKARVHRRRILSILAVVGGVVVVVIVVCLSMFLKPWRECNSGTISRLDSIFGTSDGGRVWAVGEKGTITESDDGGARWTPLRSGTTEDLRSIFGTSDGKRLWAAGEEGTILEADDGGGTWSARNSGTTNFLNSIFGNGDGTRLWIVGGAGAILESGDGGTTWRARKSGTSLGCIDI
jgi:hypothetical protein